MAVDDAGDVYVVGTYTGRPDLGGGPLPTASWGAIFLVKYSGTDGAHLWSRTFTAETAGGFSIAAGADGIAIVAKTYGTVDFGGGPLGEERAFWHVVARFSARGEHVWSAGLGHFFGTETAVGIDPSGDVVVGLDVSSDVEAFKLAAGTGELVWSRLLGVATYDAFATDLAVDPACNIFLTGRADYRAFLARLSP